jgi:hypothetical protein
MFSCASVGAACKLSKTSVDKNELLTLSKSKRATLYKVIGDMIEFDKVNFKEHLICPKTVFGYIFILHLWAIS